MTATYKKALLASAILLALSGADVFAEAPQMTGSQNGMSQSSMIDVKNGKEAGKTAEISDQTEKAEPSMEVKESHQTVAVGDASLYLSADDDATIEAHTGKTIAHVDFDGSRKKSRRSCPLFYRANRAAPSRLRASAMMWHLLARQVFSLRSVRISRKSLKAWTSPMVLSQIPSFVMWNSPAIPSSPLTT